jgi:hypothetical protein
MDTHKNEPAGGSCWTALGHGVQATSSKPQFVIRRCLSLALRVISLRRSKQIAFGEEQTSNGSRNPQSRSRMTLLRHGQLDLL